MNKKIVSAIGIALILGIAGITMARDSKERLSVGADAPRLTGVDQMGKSHKLEETRGAFTLVYFYPKDATPGCTKEACAFRNVWKKYQAAGIKLFGVSNGTVQSHKKFAQTHNLPFPLIADDNRKWGKAFGVRTILGMYKRVSFLINPKGKIAKVYADVDPGLHAKEVLKDVEALGGGK